MTKQFWEICEGAGVDLQRVYGGTCFLYKPLLFTEELVSLALSLAQRHSLPELSAQSSDANLRDFAESARRVKSEFTNSIEVKHLLEKLIFERYKDFSDYRISFDLPRLRIIPNSSILSSGISYNYKPHRDTWYGARQDQINHWIAVKDVTKDSTFFVAPAYFTNPIKNTSCDFNLDEWDSKHRYSASSNIKAENRPHPLPLDPLDHHLLLPAAIPRSHEICFSGHHLHGSLPNTTTKTRMSIDYRVIVSGQDHFCPPNLDSNARGDYSKYLIPHPSF